jgi:tetratricopeptide (TPR) repeat protein
MTRRTAPVGRWRHAAALATIAAVATVTWSGAREAGFVFDSRLLVLENPILQTAARENVRFLLTHDYWQPRKTDGLYRPLTMLSYLLHTAFVGHGGRAAGYVVENVVLHVACALLLYALVWRTARRPWAALVAALLFVVHPVTTEAVTNVVGRADVLAALGVLGGLLCWSAATTRRGWRRFLCDAGLVLAATTAFFAKETGLVLAVAVVLWDLAFPVDGRPRVRREHALVALVLVGYLGARLWVARHGPPPPPTAPIDNPLVELSFLAARTTAASVLVRELALVFWPATLSGDYSFRAIAPLASPPRTFGDWAGLVALIGCLSVPWWLARLRRPHPALFFFLAFATLSLLPTANLVVLVGSIMGERFLYLPLAGIVAALALVADAASSGGRGRRAVTSALVVAAIAGCAARTIARNRDWRDEVTFWAATVRAVPASAKAHRAYAVALHDADPARQNLGLVIVEGEQAVAIRPDYREALVDLGGYYVEQGDRVAHEFPDAAAHWYALAGDVLERALPRQTLGADSQRALYTNLALAELRLEHYEEAIAALDMLRRLDPGDVRHYVDLAAVRQAIGAWEDAAVALLEALAIAPEDADVGRRLVELYRTHGGTGVVKAPDGAVHVNVDDPTVRAHWCRAWRELEEVLGGAGLTDAATQAHEHAVEACVPSDAATR